MHAVLCCAVLMYYACYAAVLRMLCCCAVHAVLLRFACCALLGCRGACLQSPDIRLEGGFINGLKAPVTQQLRRFLMRAVTQML